MDRVDMKEEKKKIQLNATTDHTQQDIIGCKLKCIETCTLLNRILIIPQVIFTAYYGDINQSDKITGVGKIKI